MTRLRARGPAAFLAAALAAGISAAAPPPPPETSIRDVPPLIWSIKGPEKTAWEHCLILLTGRKQGQPPPRLSALCRTDSEISDSVLTTVALSSHAIEVEAASDGGLRVLVGRSGGIDEVRLDTPGATARTVSLIEDVALDPGWLGDRPDLDGDGRKDLLQATYDGVALWRREEDGRMTRLPGELLPPVARFDGEGLTVHGKYVVEPVPPAPVRWTWPETLPGGRLKTFRVPLDPAGGKPCAAWIETVGQVAVHKAVFLSGEPPRLVALTRPADKVALFGNSSILVAQLTCDETARGSRPKQRMTTGFDANFGWKGLDVKDVNEDGKPDILIAGRQGVVQERYEVAVYLGVADGGFAATPVSGVRSDLDPLAARWEDDVDGDGRHDMIVLDRTRLLVARGIPARGPGDLPFDLRKPMLVPFPESVRPRYLLDPVDFDGDGKLEVVVAGEERKEEKGKKGQPKTSFADRVDKDTRLVIVRLPTDKAGTR